MSYDLMVFDPNVAPRDREGFMEWYRDLTQWGEARDYNSPERMTGNLRLFYDRMRGEFPPMNGSFQAGNDAQPAKPGFFQRLLGQKPEPYVQIDDAMVTDYSCATHGIYLAFSSDLAGRAYNSCFNAALSCEVGFFNVSRSNGEILHDPGQFDDFMGL